MILTLILWIFGNKLYLRNLDWLDFPVNLGGQICIPFVFVTLLLDPLHFYTWDVKFCLAPDHKRWLSSTLKILVCSKMTIRPDLSDGKIFCTLFLFDLKSFSIGNIQLKPSTLKVISATIAANSRPWVIPPISYREKIFCILLKEMVPYAFQPKIAPYGFKIMVTCRGKW